MTVKSLAEQIADILTPGQAPGLAAGNRIYRLRPLLPLDQVIEMGEAMDAEGQARLMQFLNGEHILIYGGAVYLAEKGLNLQGRLKEIVSIYRAHIKQVVGDKQALINLYDTIPVEDIANLTQDHVIFVMKKLARSNKMALAAIRYLPEYDIHFEKSVFRMPGCTIALHIDNKLHLSEPEIVADSFYEHPFVFRDTHFFGQPMCMGSFKSSSDRQQMNRLRFANTVNNHIKQAVQILVSGYRRGVAPANGHLISEKYKKYLVKGRGREAKKKKY